MIKLKSAHLQNFQKHEDLKVDFNDGITIYTGLTEAGKSCVRRAIDWVINCFEGSQTVSEKDFRKEGTKITTVTLVFDTGTDTIEVEKIRSNSINRYVLRMPNEEEQAFDSFGKETPDAIRTAIGMSAIKIEKDSLNLNISEQLSLPFLLDRPASFRAKLFNKLTGNELLDTLFKKCNKESLRIGRELKETEENLSKQEDEVVEYTMKYKENKKKVESIKQKFSELKTKSDLVDKLTSIAKDITNNNTDLDEVNKKLASMAIIKEDTIVALRTKADEHEKFEKIIAELDDVNSELQKIKDTKIVVPVFNSEDFYKKGELFKKLNDCSIAIDDIVKKNKNMDVLIVDSLNMLKKDEDDLKEIWKNLDGVCPLCKGKK